MKAKIFTIMASLLMMGSISYAQISSNPNFKWGQAQGRLSLNQAQANIGFVSDVVDLVSEVTGQDKDVILIMACSETELGKSAVRACQYAAKLVGEKSVSIKDVLTQEFDLLDGGEGAPGEIKNSDRLAKTVNQIAKSVLGKK